MLHYWFNWIWNLLIKEFSHFSEFTIRSKSINSNHSFIPAFVYENFRFEIFAQPVPTRDQTAYKHLVNEYSILENQDTTFKQRILELKEDGMKTEPAFAKVLGLEGDPYEAMLEI